MRKTRQRYPSEKELECAAKLAGETELSPNEKDQAEAFLIKVMTRFVYLNNGTEEQRAMVDLCLSKMEEKNGFGTILTDYNSLERPVPAATDLYGPIGRYKGGLSLIQLNDVINGINTIIEIEHEVAALREKAIHERRDEALAADKVAAINQEIAVATVQEECFPSAGGRDKIELTKSKNCSRSATPIAYGRREKRP